MTHVSTKMKRKHQVAIYENKQARVRPKGKGYMIATHVALCIFKNGIFQYLENSRFINRICCH